jgi:UDP-glucose:(heptosyl)LPS alpha-1,3-glucosyltransferase
VGNTDRLALAFVVDRFGNRFGGAEAYGVELVRELARRHDVTIIARDYDDACGLHLPFVALRSWRGWPSWIRVLIFAVRARRATRDKFDIVHSHMNGWCGDIEVIHVTPVRYNWRVRPLPWFKRLTSYVSLRIQTYLALERLRTRPRLAHRTVAVSGLIAEQLRQAYGNDFIAPVIPPGVTRPPMPTAAERERLRASMGFSPEDQVCLLVARNPMRKGLPTILAALQALPAVVKLLVVGSDVSTRDFIDRTPAYRGLVERIVLVDATPEVDQYYSLANVYVHPTLNDSFGMAPLEAMSFGLPVILSPTPWCGFADYVRHGQDALVLSHPENSTELANYIMQLIEDLELRSTLLQQAQNLLDRHGWPQVAHEYEALYKAVLAERAAAA